MGGKSTGGAKATHSSRNRISRTNPSSSSSIHLDEPPLAVLPPPDLMRHSKSTSQYDSTANQLSLSKNIYGIRDAFKNIICIAFGGGREVSCSRNSAPSAMSVDNATSTSCRHVVSLAGLCAIVVGRELGVGQEGDRTDGDESTDDEKCGNEEEEATKWVDEIYEGIPFHLRRYVPPQRVYFCVRRSLGV
jgi:hypothetical protein